MFPAFHVSYCKPQLQQDWAQDSNRGGWIIPAWGLLLGSPHLYWDTQSTSERVVPGQALCAVRWMVPIADPSPPCGAVAGSPCVGSCSGATPHSRYLACPLQRPRQESGSDPTAEDEQILLSLCIVWFSSDSLRVMGRCSIMLLLLPFLPGASRDSHSLPVLGPLWLTWFGSNARWLLLWSLNKK